MNKWMSPSKLQKSVLKDMHICWILLSDFVFSFELYSYVAICRNSGSTKVALFPRIPVHLMYLVVQGCLLKGSSLLF